MIRALVLAVALAATPALAGCDTLIAKSPAVYVDSFEMAASIANAAVVALWPTVYASLPVADQVAAQLQYQKAETAYGDTITALNAGLAAYQDDAQQDWTSLIASAQTALGAVVAVIDLYVHAPSATGAARPVMQLTSTYQLSRAQLAQQLATVNRYH